MDVGPAIEVLGSLAPHLGLVHASFFLRAREGGDVVRFAAVAPSDDGSPDPEPSALAWASDAPSADGPEFLSGAEAFLTFRVGRGDDVGLFLRMGGEPTATQRDLLRHLRVALDRLLSEQARARAFADDIELTLRVLTHDLKSPTNAVAGFVDILFEDFGATLPEGAPELLHRVRSSAGRLQLLLEGVYRLRVATFAPLKPAHVELSHVLQDALQRVRDRHPGVACDASLPAGLPAVLADADKLESAVGAVFDNAFKFRDAARPLRLEVAYARLGPDRHGLTISDSSLGFEERFCEAVFEPFRRLHPPSDYPGAGIGLTAARVALGRHGGRMRIEAAPHEGVRAMLEFTEIAPPRSPAP